MIDPIDFGEEFSLRPTSQIANHFVRKQLCASGSLLDSFRNSKLELNLIPNYLQIAS